MRERPVLLLVDGHKSHMTLELVDLARENNVILFCLPPHTTHALQPLDVSVFKALKAHFSRSLRAVCFTRKDFMVTKRDFARVVKEPFELAFSMTNIKNGFAKCGIFPFNPDAVDKKKMLPSEMHRDTVEETPSVSSSDAATPGGQSSGSVVGDGPESQSSGSVVGDGPEGQSSGSVVGDGPEGQSSGSVVGDGPEGQSSGSIAGDGSESAFVSGQFTPPLFDTPSTSNTNTSTTPSTPCSRTLWFQLGLFLPILQTFCRHQALLHNLSDK